jgi:outer membrane protein TolC
MNRRNIIIFFISLILSILAASDGYTASDLSLDEAIRTALKINPQAVISRESETAADAKARGALSAYYPQLSIGVDWNKGRSFLTAVESIKPTEVTTGSLNLRQTIYDFGHTAGVVDAARNIKKAETEMVAVTGKNIVFRVRAAFFRSLAADKQVLSVRSSVKDRAELFRQSQEFFKEGIRARIDVAKAEANLYAARTLLSQAENTRDNEIGRAHV